LARINTIFLVRNAEGFGTQAQLIDVYEGIAMNARYVSYSMQLALPLGVNLPQAVYAVRAGSAAQGVDEVNSASTEEWPLLLTPILSGEDGRARMEAVFHVAAQQDVRAPSQAVAAGG
jgi:hypothetical protein